MSTQLIRSLLPLLVCAGVIGAGATCSSASNDGVPSARDIPADTLLATVDTVWAPTRIASTDTLRVRLQGMVGPNGCYSLAGVEREQRGGTVVLRPIVRHSGQGMCTMALVSLDEEITLEPPFPEGTLRIVVPQTDRPPVRTTVRVQNIPKTGGG